MKDMKDIKGKVSTMTPLARTATFLSVLSMIWTTYSIIDLFYIKSGVPQGGEIPASVWVGFTVALSADIVWGALIYASYKGIAPGGHNWITTAAGWIALLAVVGLVGWHGFEAGNDAMMLGGPFLPLGAKGVWALALSQMKDPAALNREQQKEIHDRTRDGIFDAQLAEADRKAQEAAHKAARKAEEMAHEAEMKRIAMEHEKEMARIQAEADQKRALADTRAQIIIDQTTTQHRIDVMRYEKQTELRNMQPLTMPGELAVPEDLSQRKALGRMQSVPTDKVRPLTVTVPVTGLSEAQQRKKQIAALWYIERDRAEAEGRVLSQADFCRAKGINNPSDLTRAKAQFPEDSFSEEDLAEACGS